MSSNFRVTTGIYVAAEWCFRRDGALLASASGGSGQYEVRLWDLRTQELAGTLTGLRDVVSVAFSPDGASLAAGSVQSSCDQAVGCGGPTTDWHFGRAAWSANRVSWPFRPSVHSWLPGLHDGTVNLWNVETRELTATLEAHPSRISAMSFSPDGALLATGGFDSPARDHSVKLWDVGAKTLVATLEGHSGTIDDVSFSPDGALLATAARADEVKLWDMAARVPIATLEAVEGQAYLTFSRDGMILAVGQSRQIKLWDVAARRVTVNPGLYGFDELP